MSEQNQAPEQDVQEFNNEMAQRRSKPLRCVSRANAFLNDFRRDHISSDIHAAFGDGRATKKLEALRQGQDCRPYHDPYQTFATLQDMGGKIRVYDPR